MKTEVSSNRHSKEHQALKVLHAYSPSGLQKAIDTLASQYEGWTIIELSMSANENGYTALVLLGRDYEQ